MSMNPNKTFSAGEILNISSRSLMEQRQNLTSSGMSHGGISICEVDIDTENWCITFPVFSHIVIFQKSWCCRWCYTDPSRPSFVLPECHALFRQTDRDDDGDGDGEDGPAPPPPPHDSTIKWYQHTVNAGDRYCRSSDLTFMSTIKSLGVWEGSAENTFVGYTPIELSGPTSTEPDSHVQNCYEIGHSLVYPLDDYDYEDHFQTAPNSFGPQYLKCYCEQEKVRCKMTPPAFITDILEYCHAYRVARTQSEFVGQLFDPDQILADDFPWADGQFSDHPSQNPEIRETFPTAWQCDVQREQRYGWVELYQGDQALGAEDEDGNQGWEVERCAATSFISQHPPAQCSIEQYGECDGIGGFTDVNRGSVTWKWGGPISGESGYDQGVFNQIRLGQSSRENAKDFWQDYWDQLQSETIGTLPLWCETDGISLLKNNPSFFFPHDIFADESGASLDGLLLHAKINFHLDHNRCAGVVGVDDGVTAADGVIVGAEIRWYWESATCPAGSSLLDSSLLFTSKIAPLGAMANPNLGTGGFTGLQGSPIPISGPTGTDKTGTDVHCFEISHHINIEQDANLPYGNFASGDGSSQLVDPNSFGPQYFFCKCFRPPGGVEPIVQCKMKPPVFIRDVLDICSKVQEHIATVQTTQNQPDMTFVDVFPNSQSFDAWFETTFAVTSWTDHRSGKSPLDPARRQSDGWQCGTTFSGTQVGSISEVSAYPSIAILNKAEAGNGRDTPNSDCAPVPSDCYTNDDANTRCSLDQESDVAWSWGSEPLWHGRLPKDHVTPKEFVYQQYQAGLLTPDPPLVSPGTAAPVDYCTSFNHEDPSTFPMSFFFPNNGNSADQVYDPANAAATATALQNLFFPASSTSPSAADGIKSVSTNFNLEHARCVDFDT